MAQTSYSINIDQAYAGMLADGAPHLIRGQSVNADPGGNPIPFGVALKAGPGTGQLQLPSAAGDVIVGLSVFQQTVDQFAQGLLNPQVAGAGIGQGALVSLLDEGEVYVTVEETVTPASPVFVRIANGVADNTKTQKGAFRASSDSGTAIEVPGARYVTGAGAGGLAIVQFSALTEQAMLSDLAGVHTIALSSSAKDGTSHAWTISGQGQDQFGNPVAQAAELHVEVLAPTATKGAIAAVASHGTIDVNAGAVTTAAGAKQEAWLTTKSDGSFQFTVTDDQAESVFVKVSGNTCLAGALKLT